MQMLCVITTAGENSTAYCAVFRDTSAINGRFGDTYSLQRYVRQKRGTRASRFFLQTNNGGDRRGDLRVNFTNKEIVTAFPASCKLEVTHVTILVSVYSPPATISTVTHVTGSRDWRGVMYGVEDEGFVCREEAFDENSCASASSGDVFEVRTS